MSIAKDKESAVIDPLKELVAYFGPLLGEKGLAQVGLSHEDFAEVHNTFKQKVLHEAIKLVTPEMLRLAVTGSPDDCLSQLEKLGKAGVNQVLIGAPLGPNPRESIDMIGKEIIPRLKSE
jgi:5,10-methylenetetrahydromethanopterin reductase